MVLIETMVLLLICFGTPGGPGSGVRAEDLSRVSTVSGQPSPELADHEACPPPGISIQDHSLREVVQLLCHDSLTFQRQCARIAPHRELSVDVRLKSPTESFGARAWTTFKTANNAGVRVEVRITAGWDAAELLGHEFEHIIEWLDGVHGGGHSHERDGGVSVGRYGEIVETARATRVGRIVADEEAAAQRRRGESASRRRR
jgi:hypothetical protein